MKLHGGRKDDVQELASGGQSEMNSYRETAVIAANLISAGEVSDPTKAWNQATMQLFPSSQELRKKGCPKAAFLGLCNRGLIAGVGAESSAKITKNGQYAIDAIQVLRENRFIASQPDLLWRKVAGSAKTHNHQMDVVIGLWEADLITRN